MAVFFFFLSFTSLLADCSEISQLLAHQAGSLQPPGLLGVFRRRNDAPRGKLPR